MACYRIGYCLIVSAALFCFPAAAAEGDAGKLVEGNSAFAFDLYRRLSRAEGNLFFSPYSISTALAMTYGGARGNTEKEMAAVMRFGLEPGRLHSGFAALQSELEELEKIGGIELNVANSLWPQKEHAFLREYLSLVEKNYGVSITAVDYAGALEAARQTINRWVEDKTQERIKDLIRPGILQTLTRLVLVNAIYFKGAWEHPFEPKSTEEAPFYLSAGKSVPAQIMAEEGDFEYAQADGIQILELPYAGGKLSMTVLLPEAGGMKRLEDGLSREKIARWRSLVEKRSVQVFLPKFKTTAEFRLDQELKEMGMEDAFDDIKADFSGMNGGRDLFISAVLHKAFVEVSEQGTEAAAATAVVMLLRGAMPAPPTVFRADRPFVFLIEDKKNRSILFMGRISNPE